MTSEQYRRWSAPFRGKRAAWVPRADRVLTLLVYVCYPALIVYAWIVAEEVPWQALWIPASSLVLVSLVRRLINRRRPYERLDIEPLIQKKTAGRSMPSRHAFSVWVIAMTAWWLLPPLGVVLTVVGVLLCATRVLGGVHDVWDVTVGALAGIAAGVLGYWILLL